MKRTIGLALTDLANSGSMTHTRYNQDRVLARDTGVPSCGGNSAHPDHAFSSLINVDCPRFGASLPRSCPPSRPVGSFERITTYYVPGQGAEIIATTPDGKTLIYTDSASEESGAVSQTPWSLARMANMRRLLSKMSATRTSATARCRRILLLSLSMCPSTPTIRRE